MGSNGFKIFCSNENKNIKEILFAYNDHNFQSLKDFNSFSYFNKRNETSNINIKKQNETEKNNAINEKNKIYGECVLRFIDSPEIIIKDNGKLFKPNINDDSYSYNVLMSCNRSVIRV